MLETRNCLQAIAHRWLDAGWQRGDTAAVGSLYAPDFVDLGNPVGRPGTADENIAGIDALYAAFPDFHAVADDVVVDVDGGKAAVRWGATGTHRGAFMGADPTGRRVAFQGIEILSIRDGLIVERAGEWDSLALLQQLGVLP